MCTHVLWAVCFTAPSDVGRSLRFCLWPWVGITLDVRGYCQVINFDSPRGGISLVTEKGPVTTSRLLIQKAIPADTGLYTCDPSNANPASVRVHILNGKGVTLSHIARKSPIQLTLNSVVRVFVKIFIVITVIITNYNWVVTRWQ